uniref:Uncharacterized protein n=1 Tax=Aegilops tauschii subsp. strangulata TaxID=200361 RepID=A0A453CWY6_AEGTS
HGCSLPQVPSLRYPHPRLMAHLLSPALPVLPPLPLLLWARLRRDVRPHPAVGAHGARCQLPASSP